MAEYIDENDDFNFEEEYGAFQRRGYLERDVLAEVGVDVERKLTTLRDPNHRFYFYVNSVAKYAASNDVAGLVYTDVQNILKYIAVVPNARYKNPTAFVLGYGLTKLGDINKRDLNSLAKQLKQLELNVRVEDIIRYSTMWITIRKKYLNL